MTQVFGNMAKNWIAKATTRMEQKGTKGLFSKAAEQAGMSTSAYAKKVLADPNASPLQRKRAQFAENAINASRG